MADQTTSEPDKNCLECGQALGAGRGDRKYCNDVCRTAYNNRRRKEPNLPPNIELEDRIEAGTNAAIQRVYNILQSNRVKLCNMISLYETSLSLHEFYGFGVNLKYFTSEYKDDHGQIFRMCFDHGYAIDGERVYLIYNGGEIHFN